MYNHKSEYLFACVYILEEDFVQDWIVLEVCFSCPQVCEAFFSFEQKFGHKVAPI